MLRKYWRKGASEKPEHIESFRSCCTAVSVLSFVFVSVSVCISPADEPLSSKKSRKPCLAPSQLAIHTQLEKLELSDIIYIIKSRATIEGKVYVKVSKVVLINVQSHQAWCIHLRSTTENSPWGAHCVRGKTKHAAGRGCERCEGAARAALHHTEHGSGLLSNTAPGRFADTFSCPIFTCPLIALPTWHIPYNTRLLLSLFLWAVLIRSLSCPFLPLPTARQKDALPYPLCHSTVLFLLLTLLLFSICLHTRRHSSASLPHPFPCSGSDRVTRSVSGLAKSCTGEWEKQIIRC